MLEALGTLAPVSDETLDTRPVEEAEPTAHASIGLSRGWFVGLVVVVVVAVLTGTVALFGGRAETGEVRYFKRFDSVDDAYLNGSTTETRAWMRDHFYRAESWSPFFDDKTSWYPQGLGGHNLYAIYPHETQTLTAHPDWVLRDAQGQRLYIPYACASGTCPQFAGDPGNPAFRAAGIERIKGLIAKGYKGIWLDDVNLDFRVGNGAGAFTAPIDPRTGAPMTFDNWRRYVAEYVEQIRAAIPHAEILHNSIWYAVQPSRLNDPYVQRQVAAADYINIERGVNDAGLTGGTGEWSLRTLLNQIDTIHATGRKVVLDAFDETPAGREYNLAAYFLVSRPGDGIGLSGMRPGTWWHMYDVQLGTPNGERTTWQNLLRRDFQNGVALLNEPGAPTRTVDLGQPMIDSSGRTTTTVTLAAGQGAVLRRTTGASR